jgi:hypothetical protein
MRCGRSGSSSEADRAAVGTQATRTYTGENVGLQLLKAGESMVSGAMISGAMQFIENQEHLISLSCTS